MSDRRLGGGRILGSGKSLAPLPAVVGQQNLEATPPTTDVASSQASILSGSKSLSFSDGNQDLISAVCLRNEDPSTVVPARTQLYCPICNEEMMTLLQLNRHLDDNHQELPVFQQDEVKTWLDKQVVRAKKFQPLLVINQKLKGLDVFESNSPTPPTNPTRSTSAGSSLILSEVQRSDPDEVVTRAHWQRSGYNDKCTEPVCGNRLGPVNGSVNCRKCGKLFCEDHSMYQIKLSRSAQHEPVRGLWCRVCETCYKSRDGYNDHHGFERDHTNDFMATRRKMLDKAYLETSRIEKRLAKLTQLLMSSLENPPENSGVMISLAGQRSQRKILEQSIVAWEDDAAVLRCPLCHKEFGSWLFRRHHCRLCGRVVCADMESRCSSEINLDAMAKKDRDLTLDIRICRNCQSTLYSKRNFETEVLQKSTDQRAYENLIQFEQGIRLLLPNFQRLLIALQDPEIPPSRTQLTEAAKVRKRLIDSFGKYDLAAKRIRDLPSQCPAQLKLQQAIFQRSSNFLSIYMLPLKSLPKLLKHASPNGSTARPGTALAVIKKESSEISSQVSSSSAISAMETEEKELSMQIMVLEEQRFMLGEMITASRKARRFDELVLLEENMAELERECDRLHGVLEQLDIKCFPEG